MMEVIRNSPFFWITVTVAGFLLGSILNRKYKTVIFNELLISVAVVITVLKFTNTAYTSYMQGGKYISFILTPATACLGVKLYKHIGEIQKNAIPIMSGIIMGMITSFSSMWVVRKVFDLSQTQYATLLPKSVTAAIAKGVSESLDGNVAITTATVILTGVMIAVFGKYLIKIFKIENPIAIGVSLGVSGHGQGTVLALRENDTAGAVASLSMSLSALFTVIVAPIWFNFTV